jgi:hypothetical protein
MRAHFGGYFFGQVGTFVYLIETMKSAPEFDVALWPQFSLYNLVVANFWPLYWVGYFIDRMKLERIYWHVYDVAQARAADVLALVHYFAQQS